MEYYLTISGELYHDGTKGMRWGYNDGKKNGKRTAGEIKEEIADSLAKRQKAKDAQKRAEALKESTELARVRAANSYDEAASDGRVSRKERKVIEKDVDRYNSLKSEYNNTARAADSYLEAYGRTKIGQIENDIKDVANKVSKKVNDVLKSLEIKFREEVYGEKVRYTDSGTMIVDVSDATASRKKKYGL